MSQLQNNQQQLQDKLRIPGIVIITMSSLLIVVSLLIIAAGFSLLAASAPSSSNDFSFVEGAFFIALGVILLLGNVFSLIAGSMLLKNSPRAKAWSIYVIVSGIFSGILGWVMVGSAIYSLVNIKNLAATPPKDSTRVEPESNIAHTTDEITQAAVKKIRIAGVANLVIGIVTLSVSLPILLLLIAALLANVNIHALAGSGSTPARESGFVYFILFMVLILTIIDAFTIVAGVKMRKNPQNTKNWVAFAVIVGAIQFTSITGIVLLIFNVIALTAYKDIDQLAAPNTTSAH